MVYRFPRNATIIFAIAAICLLVVGLSARPARAVSAVCSWCIVTGQPEILNLYWDTSVAKWNSDVASTDPSETVAAIDTLTQALVNSNYFGGLQSSYGVHSGIVMLPSMVVGSACLGPPTNMDVPHIDELMNCWVNQNPSLTTNNRGNLIVVLYIPPSASAGHQCDLASPPVGAWHQSNNGIAVAIMPTVRNCSSNLLSLFGLATHEIAEAMTDPNPFWGFAMPQEIGDMCETGAGRFVPFFDQFEVSSYWANSSNSCSAIQGPPLPMTGASASVCGSGERMHATLSAPTTGLNFGAPPFDLGQNRTTMYLSAAITDPSFGSWTAQVNFNPMRLLPMVWGVSWAPTTITIDGFANYGANGLFVRPGDQIAFTVFTVDGTPQVINTTIPMPTKIVGFGLNPRAGPFFPNSQAFVSGRIVDAGGCGDQAVVVSLAATGGTLSSSNVIPSAPGMRSTIQLATDKDGSFQGVLTAPAVAQNVTISVGLPFPVSSGSTTASIVVVPLKLSLSTTRGDPIGNRKLTISGGGFQHGMTVSFTPELGGGSPGVVTPTVVSADGASADLLTPKSTLPGDGHGAVSVTVHVNNINGVNSAYEALVYNYTVPNSPTLTPLPTTSPCGSGAFSVTTYDPDGNPVAQVVNLVGPKGTFTDPGSSPDGTSLQITSNTNQPVTILNSGPITATNQSVTPPLSVTQSFRVFSAKICQGLASATGTRQPGSAAFAEELHPIIGPGCDFCGSEGKNLVAWRTTQGDPMSASPAVFASMTGPAPQELVDRYKVILLPSSTNSGAPMLDIPFGALPMDTSSPPTLVGKLIEIVDRDHHDLAALVEPMTLYISLPHTGSAGFSLYHITGSGVSARWTRDGIASVSVRGPTMSAKVTQSGTYAVGNVLVP